MAVLNQKEPNPPADGLLTVGVTGGMGSGKTVVCRFLSDRGALVFDADSVGKALLTTDPDARREIVREFGPESYRSDGTLNRGHLARIVFGDPERLATINGIVHPRVFRAFARAREDAAQAGVPLLIHEAALLFESGGDRYVDCTVYVDAPRWLRIRRVMERDGRTRREIISRMAHQMPAYKGRQRADFVIRNDGSLARLESRVEQLLNRLERRFGVPLAGD